MSSFKDCNVIFEWEDGTKIYTPVTSRSEAIRVTREKLSKGWRVSWSNALIDRMTLNRGPLPFGGGE